MMILGIMIAASAATAQPQSAAPAAIEQPQAAESEPRGPNNDQSQVVCNIEAETGSRLGRERVCRTRAEWALHQREVRERTERAQNQTQTSGE